MSTFVGRSSELELLRARLADAASGVPQVVLLEGPSGVGKSSLVQAFLSEVTSASVLTASGDENETQLRFGVLQQLLGSREAAWADVFAAGVALLQSLDERSGEDVRVFVVDDAQHADAESLNALTFALRRLRADRVLTVVTTRAEDEGELPSGLVRLAEGSQARLLLGGLDGDEVVALASALGVGVLSRSLAERLQQHTDGNPLYLRGLMRELDVESLQASAPLPAPHSYSLLVLRSVAAQTETAQQLARAASVLTDASPLSVVAAVAQSPDPEADLDDLVKAHVLVCEYAEDGWRVGFAHPLARAAVYDDLGPLDRKQLHARAATALHGDDALLHRLAAASGPDPALASDLATRASELQEAGDVRRAADYYLKAGRLAGDEGSSWLVQAATLFLIAGDVSAAKAAEDMLPEGVDGATRDYLKVRIAWFAGDAETAAELATQGWERADGLHRGGKGELAAILAQLHNLQGDGTGAAEWAQRALAEELPADLVDATTAARAIGLVIAGQPADALATLGGLPADPEEMTVDQQHQLAARGALRALGDDLDAARADLDALQRHSGSLLAPERLLGMGVLAEVDYRLGRWDSSLTLAEQTISLAEDGEQLWIQGYLHAVAVLVAAGRGWWARAEEHLASGRRLAEQLSDPVTWAVCENVGVHIASCRGEPEEVVARSQLLLSLVGGPTDEPGWLGWPVQHASALVALGRDKEAEAELDRLETIAVERGARSRLAALMRVRGELATVRREHTRARTYFDEALDLGDAASALEQGLVRASYGRFLRRRGEKRAARAQLETASDRFRELGATPFLETWSDELAACGVGVRDAAPPVTEVLTPQEQIVVRLVCEGHTNSEIAAQLVLSAKTIGYHLGNAYTKLGVHSRAQLVTRLGAS